MGSPVNFAHPMSFAEFYPFPKLPAELRSKVWEALIEPRVVSIITTDTRICSTDPVPILLHVCHESRRIGLRHYDPTVGLSYEDVVDFYENYEEPLIYFNPSIDILYCSSRYHLIPYLDSALCRYKCTTLAVEYDTFCRYIRFPTRYRSDDWDKSIAFFLKLQNIYLVREDLQLVRTGDVELIDFTDLNQLDNHIEYWDRIANRQDIISPPKLSIKSMLSKTSASTCINTQRV